jgi:hypothetical protein
VSGQEDADSNEIINVPTKDGVLVGVEGTVYFDVNYTDEKVMVQAAVNEAFTKDVDDVLGVALLINPRFVLSKVDLPQNVQDAINQAQAAFAGVTESQPRCNGRRSTRRATPPGRAGTTRARPARRSIS